MVSVERVVIPARLEVVSWWEVKVKYVWKELHGKTIKVFCCWKILSMC